MLQNLIILTLLVWLLHSTFSIAKNLRAAAKIGLPVAISPIDPINPVWILCQKYLIPLLKVLPFRLGQWTRYNHRGWLFYDKFRMHADLGDAWLHVTPGSLTLYVGNATACQEAFARKDDFTRPTHLYRGRRPELKHSYRFW